MVSTIESFFVLGTKEGHDDWNRLRISAHRERTSGCRRIPLDSQNMGCCNGDPRCPRDPWNSSTHSYSKASSRTTETKIRSKEHAILQESGVLAIRKYRLVNIVSLSPRLTGCPVVIHAATSAVLLPCLTVYCHLRRYHLVTAVCYSCSVFVQLFWCRRSGSDWIPDGPDGVPVDHVRQHPWKFHRCVLAVGLCGHSKSRFCFRYRVWRTRKFPFIIESW